MTTTAPFRSPVSRSTRLLSGDGHDLARHAARFGPRPRCGPHLIDAVAAAGLRGRGGAGFPAARKMAAVAAGRRCVLIANASEGEPLSRKDAALLHSSPHLVLDGMAAVADAIGAHESYLYVRQHMVAPLRRLIDERRTTGWDPTDITVVEAPERFVAGEKTAVIAAVGGRAAIPSDSVTSTSVSGLRGRPTLVQNVETLAHIATIARRGPDWFREVGTPDEPGTMLITLTGTNRNPEVREVPIGVPLYSVLNPVAGEPGRFRAVLVGGYHGTWHGTDQLSGQTLSRWSLSTLGASPGAGVIHTLDSGSCGVSATARIVEYLARESAGQCGPCLNGLPRLAESMAILARGRCGADVITDIRRFAGLVDGRGACHHPDGTARLVRSALTTFARDVEFHLRGRCEAGHLTQQRRIT
ncbi:NADH-ubiquinone oxidoreductase-F iron-sulfur binding region domain-containing protein [Gordonia sp. YY1]|uniref:NADH-ubiquinone oxidoreductase-F iron-sulfur binding region domain-containing protein n=1 Tax=Gordonia sp. YY1 TaxID=396712 RepID=UPI00133142D6|nr:NADH-ubiquinone oxidoreductase-F iron-sulfur binding region domain-containing protein [Gordonia sp. YY1]KAF0968308.1 NADH-quinone oxidoreductase chain 1 [Gordonia sp. YY1]